MSCVLGAAVYLSLHLLTGAEASGSKSQPSHCPQGELEVTVDGWEAAGLDSNRGWMGPGTSLLKAICSNGSEARS